MSYWATRSNGNRYRVTYNTKCRRGFEETVSLTLSRDGKTPAWAGSLKDKITSTNSGTITLTHGHCTEAHGGHSLGSAQTDSNFIRITGGLSQTHTLAYCKDVKRVGAAAANLYFGAGIFGTINIPYKRPRDTTGAVGGYLQGGLDMKLKSGNCKCGCKESGGKKTCAPEKAKFNTCFGSCSTIAGGSGELKLTTTFTDIAVGDGSNGVDLNLNGKVTISAKVCGTKINMPSVPVGLTIPNIIDLDRMNLL